MHPIVRFVWPENHETHLESRIGLEQIIRTGYDPLDDAIELLIACNDSALVLEHVRWAMQRDPARSIRILTSPERVCELNREDTLAIVREYGKFYEMEYIQFLVFVRGVREEPLHTQMGVICIELLQEANQVPVISRGRRNRVRLADQPGSNQIIDPAMLKRVEECLIRLLQFSEDYNPATLLGRIQGNSTMWDASVLLYSRVSLFALPKQRFLSKRPDAKAQGCFRYSCAQETRLSSCR